MTSMLVVREAFFEDRLRSTENNSLLKHPRTSASKRTVSTCDMVAQPPALVRRRTLFRYSSHVQDVIVFRSVITGSISQ